MKGDRDEEEMKMPDMNPGRGDCCGGDDEGDAASMTPDIEDVMRYYEAAAQEPKAELCCPTAYREEDVAHIPEEVRAISYGCGSPMAQAGVRSGEAVVDLGSGGGIDCFIAAKSVGPSGRVVGVDMTDAMLTKARSNAELVTKNLGFGNVEFRKGYLEALPVEDGFADLVTSNCVINLSTDKKSVFKEMFRVMKSGGRFVISDIISDRPVPDAMRRDVERWGECISGALTQEEFLNAAASAGFYGLSYRTDYLWKQVGGIRFSSMTFRGSKFDKERECVYVGQTAVYTGPFSTVTDDEGHVFPRGRAVEICTDTAQALSKPPYLGLFELTGVDAESSSEKGTGAENCGPGCC